MEVDASFVRDELLKIMMFQVVILSMNWKLHYDVEQTLHHFGLFIRLGRTGLFTELQMPSERSVLALGGAVAGTQRQRGWSPHHSPTHCAGSIICYVFDSHNDKLVLPC